MIKNLTAIIPTLLLGVIWSCQVCAHDSVVAIVNGKKFTYSQVMKEKASLPKQLRSTSDEKLFPVLVNKAVDSFLLKKAAEASKIGDKPEIKKVIDRAKEQIIQQDYLLGKLKSVVTADAVKAKFEEVMKNFPEEKETRARHILVKDQATAKSVIKALKLGTDFKRLAKEKSIDATAKESGDLGFFRKDEYPKEFAEVAFSLKPGTYSQEPIKTDVGWHVIKVEERRDAKPPKFDEVKDELKALMIEETLLALLQELRSKAKVELFDKEGKPLPVKEKGDKALQSTSNKSKDEASKPKK